MANIVENPTWDARRTRKSQYDWSTFLDGQARVFTQAEDFPTCKVESFLSAAKTQAKNADLKLKWRLMGEDGVQLQAFVQSIEEVETADAEPAVPTDGAEYEVPAAEFISA